MHDKADVGRLGGQFHPRKAAVFIFAEEGLGGGPFDGLIDIAPEVQRPSNRYNHRWCGRRSRRPPGSSG